MHGDDGDTIGRARVPDRVVGIPGVGGATPAAAVCAVTTALGLSDARVEAVAATRTTPDGPVVVTLVLAADGPDRRDPLAVASAPGRRLSAREREVLALVAAGLSNRAIARRLVISEKTAGHHVQNIFTKLGVHNRVQAVRAATDRGLTAGWAAPGPAASGMGRTPDAPAGTRS